MVARDAHSGLVVRGRVEATELAGNATVSERESGKELEETDAVR